MSAHVLCGAGGCTRPAHSSHFSSLLHTRGGDWGQCSAVISLPVTKWRIVVQLLQPAPLTSPRHLAALYPSFLLPDHLPPHSPGAAQSFSSGAFCNFLTSLPLGQVLSSLTWACWPHSWGSACPSGVLLTQHLASPPPLLRVWSSQHPPAPPREQWLLVSCPHLSASPRVALSQLHPICDSWYQSLTPRFLLKVISDTHRRGWRLCGVKGEDAATIAGLGGPPQAARSSLHLLMLISWL